MKKCLLEQILAKLSYIEDRLGEPSTEVRGFVDFLGMLRRLDCTSEEYESLLVWVDSFRLGRLDEELEVFREDLDSFREWICYQTPSTDKQCNET